jgi:hypothetical protein
LFEVQENIQQQRWINITDQVVEYKEKIEKTSELKIRDIKDSITAVIIFKTIFHAVL